MTSAVSKESPLFQIQTIHLCHSLPLIYSLRQGGKELVGDPGAGRPSHQRAPVSPALTRCQGVCSHVLLPVRKPPPPNKRFHFCRVYVRVCLNYSGVPSPGGSSISPVHSSKQRARNFSSSCCPIRHCLSRWKHTNTL